MEVTPLAHHGGDKKLNPSQPYRYESWELTVISYLCVLVRAQEARIRRLEQLDRQKALALDEQRRSAGRRAA